MAKKIIIGSTEVVVPLKSDISQQIKDEAQLPSLVFDTQANLEAWILDGSTEHDGFLPSDLSVGQNIYTIPVSEPDFWVKLIPVESISDLEVLGSDASNIQTTLPYTEKTTLEATDEMYVLDDGTPKKVTQSNLLKGVVPKTDIINNLTSSDTNKPLSALQGKKLNDYVSKGTFKNLVSDNWQVLGKISKSSVRGNVLLAIDLSYDNSTEPEAGLLHITSYEDNLTVQWFSKHKDIKLNDFAYYDDGTDFLIIARHDTSLVRCEFKVIFESLNGEPIKPSSSTQYFNIPPTDEYDAYTPDGYSIMMDQDLVYQTDIVNDLTTTDAGKVLDARQGKVLNDNVALKVNTSDIVDNLTSTDTNKPLSAKQGKALKDLVDTTVGDIESALDAILGV